jgi:hypothetical protein
MYHDGGKCMIYLYEKYRSQINSGASLVIQSIITSVKESPKFIELKLYFIKKFFAQTTAE